MPLVLSAAALTGCQQLNDGVNTVNGAISSSLSSVGKALGGTATTQSLGPVSSVSGLGAVCKDYEENAMAAEKQWTGKRISITNACSGSYEGQKCQRYDDGNAQNSP